MLYVFIEFKPYIKIRQTGLKLIHYKLNEVVPR